MFPARTVPLQNFFGGLVENVFNTKLGVTNPPLLDYLSNLLVEFIRLEKLYGFRSLSGHRLYRVFEMTFEAASKIGPDARAAHRHIGDFTLFYSGIFPEYVQRPSSINPDNLLNITAQGKRSYWIASQLDTDDITEPPADILIDLSQQYESYAYGLTAVRHAWEHDSSARQIVLFN